MTSRNTIRWLAALGAGALAALLFRATMLTLCKLEGAAFEPFLLQGDRVVVNRWSYGLRTGADGGLFGYGRWLRKPVRRGDIIAIDSPVDSLPGIFLCRCRHLPGDTLRLNGELFTVPGIRPTCSREDYYGVESLSSRSPVSRFIGIVAERHIIGRAVCVLYSHDDTQPPFSGFRQDRFFATIVTEP